MKKQLKVLLVSTLLLSGCSAKKEEKEEQSIDVEATYQKLVENTIDYSHSLNVQTSTNEKEFEYIQFLSDGNADLGVVNYEVYYTDDSVSDAEMIIPANEEGEYNRYVLDDTNWKFYDKLEYSLTRSIYFDLSNYCANLLGSEIELYEENSYIQDNLIHLVYIDSDASELEIDVTIQDDLITKIKMNTIYGPETGMEDISIIIIPRVNEYVGEDEYVCQTSIALDYTSQPFEDSLELLWIDNLDENQYNMLETIHQAYRNTTSQSYSVISNSNDSLYIDYLYSIDGTYAMKFLYCFNYKGDQVSSFHVSMPSSEIDNIESNEHIYDEIYYYTDSYEDYVIYDIKEPTEPINDYNTVVTLNSADVITGDPTGPTEHLLNCDSFTIEYVTDVELVDQIDDQTIYKVEETYPIYDGSIVTTTYVYIDSQGYVVSETYESEDTSETVQYIRDVPDFSVTYEKSHSILHTSLLENNYLNDLMDQYKA